MKKMSTLQLIELMTNAQLTQAPALRDISNSLNNEDLSQEMELDSIAASTISRRLRWLRTEVLQMLFKSLVTHFGRKNGFANIEKQLGHIYLIDSTTISLCLTKYPWAEFRKTKSGVKAHLRLRFSDDGSIPDKVVVTPAKRSDRTQMDQLVVDETGALNVFDRGYNDYKKFDDYCEKGILFVTRLKSNAIVNVIIDNPVDPDGVIDKDQIVRLGEGRNQMKHDLRLIETKDTEDNPIIILTDDFAISALEIGDIYRYRWQIELFFKWSARCSWTICIETCSKTRQSAFHYTRLNSASELAGGVPVRIGGWQSRPETPTCAQILLSGGMKLGKGGRKSPKGGNSYGDKYAGGPQSGHADSPKTIVWYGS